nr:glycosyltransferase family 2 protein [uncultured Mucilaginibacter sp.]
MPTSIDVIIPSFRLIPETLLPILKLQKPANATLHFYLIADNPDIVIDSSIQNLVDNNTVTLLINQQNMGASATRNRGIEAGHGEWILFLDDDIEVAPDILLTYAQAAEKYPDEIGFIGLVDMPPPPTSFAKAVDADGSMSIFSAARNYESYPWGATANIMIKRSAVGNVRFSSAYPKKGGGEEVDFFLRVRQLNGSKNYKCLPVAQVEHPWWKNGQTDYTRFYRLGIGNSYLTEHNPQYKWYDLLNTSEILLITLLVALAAMAVNFTLIIYILYFALITIITEFIVNIVRLYRKIHKVELITAFNVMLIRNTCEFGILAGNMLRFRLAGIGERFNYDGTITKKSKLFRLNRYKIIKLLIYTTVIVLVRYFKKL